jgi:YD repeat-containing protein
MSNKIKSETVYRIDHMPGEEIALEQDFDQMQSYREYDRSGRLLLEIAYTQYGEIADKIEYRYNEEGNLLETFIYGDDDEVLERKEVVWSDDNRIAREFIHYLDGSEDIHEFFYDEQGNLTGIRVKDDEDELEYVEKYFYEDGLPVKIERKNEDDDLIFSQEDEYENGKLLTRTVWSAEEEEPYTFVQHFNASGHREQELRYNSREELIERNIYEEDEHGRVVRLIEENRQRKNTTEFSYDDKGNVIHQVETDLNGELNHEILRVYSPEGDPLRTTVEAIIRQSGDKRAYSLIFKRETFED